MTELTITQWEAMIGQAYELDAEVDRIEKETLAPVRKARDELYEKILGHLAQQEISSYKSKHGTIVRMRRYSVRVPADYQAKQKFFHWLHIQSEDLYWKMMTVNSQSLNAFYKEQMELAKESGDLNFEIPGIGEPTLMESLSLRKGR